MLTSPESRSHSFAFLFADAQDHIDLGYDFMRDEYRPGRLPQRDDVYAHEFFEAPPYDGLLISRAVVGEGRWHGKYSTAQSIRFRRDGVEAFLRYPARKTGGILMGDCGAYSYIDKPEPPYDIREMVEYYAECGFTHGVSVDHVIKAYDERIGDGQNSSGMAVPVAWLERQALTLRLADDFLRTCEREKVPFVPIGVAQGWSPASYVLAARQLHDIGYDYIGVGGTASMKVPHLHRVLTAIREVVPPPVRLHVFGFSRADNLREFVPYHIESFDSTSPMTRAYRDGRRNYLAHNRWYIAIRIPNADDSLLFKREILAGMHQQHALRAKEKAALEAIRNWATHDTNSAEALLPLTDYGEHFFQVQLRARRYRGHPERSRLPIQAYQETLENRPWERCPCRICRETGVEVMIFRGANRNRRRGFHNLWEFHRQVRAARGEQHPVPLCAVVDACGKTR